MPARWRAATKPSPPLPLSPDATTILEPGLRRFAVSSATDLPAVSMSICVETPRYSEFISTAIISETVRYSPSITIHNHMPFFTTVSTI